MGMTLCPVLHKFMRNSTVFCKNARASFGRARRNERMMDERKRARSGRKRAFTERERDRGREREIETFLLCFNTNLRALVSLWFGEIHFSTFTVLGIRKSA